ncbi:TPA: hypothetical protein ACXDAY_002938 [Clostridium botulinum]|nr:hypothetical protein [Clostridium botulinum]APH22945.1 hypothetical protein NPD1_3300 [Clostridium botulinum]APQ68680.1 hypothetical protein RSJ8_1426 [Clostridium botulinum]
MNNIKNELDKIMKEYKEEIELKNKIIEKNYEMMNLKCDEVIIECRK